MNEISTQKSDNPLQWQTTKVNLRERTQHMYLNDLISDVQFCIGKKSDNKKTVPAHKFILGTSSPVFFAMLYGEFSKTDVIDIEDCEVDAFLELLRFIYCDEVHLTGQNVVDVLYLANKYIIPVLSKECVNYLLDNVQSENVLNVLNAAVYFGESRLEKHCWSILSRRTAEILSSDSFVEIEKQLLISILQKDNLNVCEIDIFNSVKRWVQAECVRKSLKKTTENQRNILKEFLNLIRFPVMSAKEFAMGPARSDLLPLADVKSIFIYLNSCVKENLKYPLVAREFKPHRCFRYVKPMKNYLWRYDEKDTDAIRFKVDQEIFLAGIGLYGSPSGGECTVSVEIVIESEPVYKHSSTFAGPPYHDINPVDNPPIHNIMFDDPLRIKENTYHDIFVLLDGPPSFAGDDGRQNVVEEGVSFVFENSTGSTNGTSFDEGQIPILLFYF